MLRLTPPLLAALLLGCSSTDAPAPTSSPPTLRPWQRVATPTSSLPSIRGLRPTRGIVHSHSPFSHDACDGEGLAADGTPNASCLADLRRGICEAGEDFVFLTDHPAHMAEQPFDALFWGGDGDELVLGSDGAPIGNRMACADGRKVLLLVGHEDAIMSLGIERHLPGTIDERMAIYNGEDAATMDALHAAGGLVAINHPEGRTPEYLASVPFDAIEIYNLHAAIDPDIRKDSLGLDPYGAAASLIPFLQHDEYGPEPDLAMLAFYEDLPLYRSTWDTLLATRHVTAVVGTDSHQNAFASAMRDGERGDSYRRMMRWMSNVVLLDGEATPASVKAAFGAGRAYVVFEVFGAPAGFDFHAEQGGTTYEMGAAAPVGSTLRVTAPALYDPDPAAPAPEIETRLLRVGASGPEVVAEGDAIAYAAAEPGIYRVEAWMVPNHLRPYLGTQPDQYVHDLLWVASNPIRVE